MIDFAAERIQVIASINYYKGQLDLLERLEKTCGANSATVVPQDQSPQVTTSTEPSASPGSTATSADSPSP